MLTVWLDGWFSSAFNIIKLIKNNPDKRPIKVIGSHHKEMGYKILCDEFYVREGRIVEKSEIEKEIELIRTIIKTREELKAANSNFEFAKEDLVDYYTYQIKANQAKLNYLIKIAKSKGIEVDMINDIKFSLWEEGEEVG